MEQAIQLDIFEWMKALGPDNLTETMLDAMQEMFDSGNISARLGSIFETMGWAEDEITAAETRHPEHAEQIRTCYLPLQPSDVLHTLFNERNYRAHVRELLERIPQGKPLAPATAVEMVILFSYASLAAPLNNDGTAAFHKLMLRAYGRNIAKEYGYEMETRPSYPHAEDELIALAERKLSNFQPRVSWDKEHKGKAK